jgi:hypothetical protein
VHYSLCRCAFQCENRAASFAYFGGSGFLHPLASQMGKGLPSARLGTAEAVKNTTIAAKTSKNRFTVLLLLRKSSHRDTLHS